MTPLKDDDEFIQVLIDRANRRDQKIEHHRNSVEAEDKAFKLTGNFLGLLILFILVAVVLG